MRETECAGPDQTLTCVNGNPPTSFDLVDAVAGQKWKIISDGTRRGKHQRNHASRSSDRQRLWQEFINFDYKPKAIQWQIQFR